MKKWNIQNKFRIQNSEFRIKDIINILLENRGLKTKKEIQEFLHPDISRITLESVGIDAKEVKKAIKRIDQTIQNKEPMVVYTDYDVDGICAGAILWETLYGLGAKVMPYVPHRVEEGYGLSEKGIDQIAKEYKAKLILTVDHGISARERVAYAAKKGIDVIITDHHLAPEKLPQAIAIIHTTKLSGSGVAWMLSRELPTPNSQLPTQRLELVALATIADLVPLIGPNRTLTKYGLEELNKTSRVGLLALIEESGLQIGNLGTYEVGHVLAPRINALGRLSHALDALRLLCTKDKQRARKLAQQLSMSNKERQQLTETTILHARELLLERQLSQNKLLFLHHESYNQGIIGLVAGKLVEEHYRPAIVVSQGETISKASARSIRGFNIVEAIRSCSDLLVDCGGHPMAAGFTIETIKLQLLKERLEILAYEQLTEEMLTRILSIDCELQPDDITWELSEQINLLTPFGMGNPQPVFVLQAVTATDIRLMGVDRRHIKFQLVELPSIDVVGFGMGELYQKLSADRRVNLAFTINQNSWNGKTRLQLKLRDLIIPS